MNNRGDVLALASALSTGDEVSLGPTDMATCAAALKFYANEQQKAGILNTLKLPTLVVAGFMGTVVLGGSSAVIGKGNTEVSAMELSSVPVAAFPTVVRRHVKAHPHTTPESLHFQHLATSYPFIDG